VAAAVAVGSNSLCAVRKASMSWRAPRTPSSARATSLAAKPTASRRDCAESSFTRLRTMSTMAAVTRWASCGLNACTSTAIVFLVES
jgi:hypothetical protein